jgi:hypothetical protein
MITALSENVCNHLSAPESILVGSVVDKVALGQVFL